VRFHHNPRRENMRQQKQPPRYRIVWDVFEMRSDGQGGFYRDLIGVAFNQRQRRVWQALQLPILTVSRRVDLL
jgi:hypothetical protein